MPSARMPSLPEWLALPKRRPGAFLPVGRWAALPGAVIALGGGWIGGWQGAATALAGLALAWVGTHHLRLRGDGVSTDAVAAQDTAQESEGHGGMHALVRDVTDEWGKQLALSRDHNRAGIERLLLTFSSLSTLMSSMSDRLTDFRPTASAGAMGEAVDAHQPALLEMMRPLRRAFDERDRMCAQLKTCTDTLVQLLSWSKEARELAQHTRMVAFNASIEAVRHTNGSPEEMAARQTISVEIRRVSESIIAMCDGMDQLLQPLHHSTHAMQQQALIQDSNDEQLRLELELSARHAITAMFESLGGSLSNGSALQEASETIASHMEQAFTEFQFGDRVEQMLQILNRDINRLCEYSASNPHPTAQDIQHWLAELSESYTMDEQRSQHHNTELIDRGSRVEFF